MGGSRVGAGRAAVPVPSPNMPRLPYPTAAYGGTVFPIKSCLAGCYTINSTTTEPPLLRNDSGLIHKNICINLAKIYPPLVDFCLHRRSFLPHCGCMQRVSRDVHEAFQAETEARPRRGVGTPRGGLETEALRPRPQPWKPTRKKGDVRAFV